MSTEKSGFTLIELMVAVAIVGILATLAISNYLSFQCRSKQAEAKANLGSIFATQQAYRSEYETYVSGVSKLGWAPSGTTRYAYSVIAADTTTFTVRALSTLLDHDPTIDVWTIDQTKAIISRTNDCGS